MRSVRTELRQDVAAANGLTGQLLSSLLGEAQQDPEIRTALPEGLFYPRREASVGAIRRAQASGRIRPDVSPYLAVDLLFGPLFYRMLVRHDRDRGLYQSGDSVCSGRHASARRHEQTGAEVHPWLLTMRTISSLAASHSAADRQDPAASGT